MKSDFLKCKKFNYDSDFARCKKLRTKTDFDLVIVEGQEVHDKRYKTLGLAGPQTADWPHVPKKSKLS